MKTFLFFGYRDWSINIFKNISSTDDDFILMTNKNLCTLNFIDLIKPDIIFFYGWSWMIKEEIINKYVCMCLHPSKLPEYRGGSPIQNQIMSGEKNSAVSIFKMGKGMDDGPIYYQFPLSLDGYLDDIFERIEKVGTQGTLKLIDEYKNGSIKLKEQNNLDATICKRLKSNNSEIKPDDFNKYNAEYFYNKVRGLQKPYPESYIKCKTGKIVLKVIDYEK